MNNRSSSSKISNAVTAIKAVERKITTTTVRVIVEAIRA